MTTNAIRWDDAAIHPVPNADREPWVIDGRPVTTRELQVLTLVARGAIDSAIATALDISTSTVKTHVRRLLARTGARSRAHLVALAYLTGILHIPSPTHARHTAELSELADDLTGQLDQARDGLRRILEQLGAPVPVETASISDLVACVLSALYAADMRRQESAPLGGASAEMEPADRLAEIRARYSALPPGPWTAVDVVGDALWVVDAVGDTVEPRRLVAVVSRASEDIWWLLDEVERLTQLRQDHAQHEPRYRDHADTHLRNQAERLTVECAALREVVDSIRTAATAVVDALHTAEVTRADA
jgi:DNA-binding CsgD family transcriptional regulator